MNAQRTAWISRAERSSFNYLVAQERIRQSPVQRIVVIEIRGQRDVTVRTGDHGEAVRHVQAAVHRWQHGGRAEIRYLRGGGLSISAFLQIYIYKDKRESNRVESYHHVAGRFVDVKHSRTRQSALTPAESSLLAQRAPPEAETLGASPGVVRRKAERAFLAPIALPSDGQFLERITISR